MKHQDLKVEKEPVPKNSKCNVTGSPDVKKLLSLIAKCQLFISYLSSGHPLSLKSYPHQVERQGGKDQAIQAYR